VSHFWFSSSSHILVDRGWEQKLSSIVWWETISKRILAFYLFASASTMSNAVEVIHVAASSKFLNWECLSRKDAYHGSSFRIMYLFWLNIFNNPVPVLLLYISTSAGRKYGTFKKLRHFCLIVCRTLPVPFAWSIILTQYDNRCEGMRVSY
jgi:hypothetical protein